MNEWKKVIFVNAVRTRMVTESRTAEDVIQDYTKLTEEERYEILGAL
ncbi:MAG: hypothetical protein RR657_05065 [Peptostreptococcaceae bacterium]